MSLQVFRAMDISASGLAAERLRLDLIASNLANINTTRTASGEPYRRKVAVFRSRQATFGSLLSAGLRRGRHVGYGVEVVAVREDPSPFKVRYDPGHPDADENGYVRYPNVDLATEMVDLITASRAYEANVTAIQVAKEMAMRALDLGRV